MLVTTQYLAEAELCDNVALIANGRLVAYDTPDGLRRAAIGGDIIEVETVHAFDGARARGVAERRLDQPARPAPRAGRRRRCRVGDADRGGRDRRAWRRGRERPGVPADVRRDLRRRSSAVTARLAVSRPTQRRWPDEGPDRRPRSPVRVPRQGARRDHPPAGRAGQPRPGPVPHHGHLRPRLRRLSQPAPDRRRRPARDRPSAEPRRTTRRSPATPSVVDRGDGGPGAARGAAGDQQIEVVVVAPDGRRGAFPERRAVGHRRRGQHRRPGPGRVRERSSCSCWRPR